MKIKFNPLILISLACYGMMAQNPPGVLRSQTNLFRAGDEVVKLEASYVSPGDTGKGVTWNFSSLQLTGGEYPVNYFKTTGGATLAGTENRSVQQYLVSGDSLLLEVDENRLSFTRLEKPEVIMVFPASYGDERKGHFYGRGKYCERLEMDVAGLTHSRVDGYGTLILPGNDTIPRALRVHTSKITWTDFRPVSGEFDVNTPRETPLSYQEVLLRWQQDTAYTETGSDRWYVEGNRYPVLEITRTCRKVNGKEVHSYGKTYIFHPLDQQYLAEDTANLALLEEVKKSYPAGNGQLTMESWKVQTYPNPVVNELSISLQPERATEVRASVYSLQGQLVERKVFPAAGGVHTETWDLSRLPKGNYILLIQAGGKSDKKVFVKQ